MPMVYWENPKQKPRRKKRNNRFYQIPQPQPQEEPKQPKQSDYYYQSPKQVYNKYTTLLNQGKIDPKESSPPITSIKILTYLASDSKGRPDRLQESDSVRYVYEMLHSRDVSTMSTLRVWTDVFDDYFSDATIIQTAHMVQRLVDELKLTQDRNQKLIALLDAFSLFAIDVENAREEDVKNLKRILVAFRSNIRAIDRRIEEIQEEDGGQIYDNEDVKRYFKMRDDIEEANRQIFSKGYVNQRRMYDYLDELEKGKDPEPPKILGKLASIKPVTVEQAQQVEAVSQIAYEKGMMEALGQAIYAGKIGQFQQGQLMQTVGLGILSKNKQTDTYGFDQISEHKKVNARQRQIQQRKLNAILKKKQKSLLKSNLSDLTAMAGAQQQIWQPIWYAESLKKSNLSDFFTIDATKASRAYRKLYPEGQPPQDVARQSQNFFRWMAQYVESGIIPEVKAGMELIKDLSAEEIDAVNEMYQKMLTKLKRSRVFKVVGETIAKATQLLANVIGQFAVATNSLTSSMASFSSMFENMFSPVSAIVSVIGLAVGGLQTQGLLFEPMINSILSIFKLFTTGKKKGKRGGSDDDGTASLKGQSEQEGYVSFIQSIVSIFQSIASAVVSVIMQALNQVLGGVAMLTNVLESMFALLKKLFATSVLMEAILNMLNLILVMFFLPFFDVFANTLLDAVFSLILWAVSFNLADKEYLIQPIVDLQTGIYNCLQNNMVLIKNTIHDQIQEFLPLLLEMFFDLLPFVAYFIETVVDNQANVRLLLKNGIQVQLELINGNIIKLFIVFGTECMKFLLTHSEGFLKLFESQCWIMEKVLGITKFVSEYLLVFCMAQGAQMGGFLATIGTLQFMEGSLIVDQAIQIVTRSVAKEVAVNFLKNIGFGQAEGAQIGALLYALFFSFAEFAEGGYIPATPGGMFVRIAEKETEYLIPESKIHMIRGHNNLVLEVNGDVWGVDNTANQIIDAVDGQSNYSRYR